MPDRGTEEAAYRLRDQQGDPDAAFELGNLLAARHDLAGALEAYRRADGRGHPTAAANLGLLLQAAGDAAGAEEAYRRADARGDALGALRLGELLAARGDWDGAKAAYARAEQRSTPGGRFDLAALLAPEPASAGRAGQRSAFASPVLVGAVTVLVVLVAGSTAPSGSRRCRGRARWRSSGGLPRSRR